MAKDERVDVIQMVYGERQTIVDENQQYQSDTGDELQPVFSPLLQSGHKGARTSKSFYHYTISKLISS